MGDWKKICTLEEIPRRGARVVRHGGVDIAVFRTGADEVFALHDQCPHKGGPLSQGIVSGRSVTCPLHGWNIGLGDGKAAPPDEGCVPCLAVKVDAGAVYLQVEKS
ncbi:MAG: nitrite reductase small subunit NirD [Pseudomonadota bacterium]